ADLLEGLAPPGELLREGDRLLTAICDDSRQVQPGALFVAVRGTTADGRRFVADAIKRGAAVVLGEGLEPHEGALILNVPDARAALAQLALRWHGLAEGCCGLKLAGLTGTNGKSTSAFMATAILRAAGLRCGMLGTVQYDLCGRSVRAGMTTPGPLELAACLRECADNGAAAAIMEVSSHALDQRRVDGLRFAAAAFTNLTGDHLDYHGTVENYRAAKTRLFAGLDADAVAVVNADDPSHVHMLADCRARVVKFSLAPDSGSATRPATEIQARITRRTSAGTFYRMRIEGRELVLENALVGEHNVYNAMTAAGLAHALGATPDHIAAGLLAVRNVPGRLQRVPCASPADVFVDYAHTDDALRNVLSVLKPLTRRRLIVVFGCGGDRDRTKRPRMAQAAAAFGDAILVTSDNPRTEAQRAIIDEILTGFDAVSRRRVLVEPDRAAAIRAALAAAAEGDVVLIAGKGHENYQILGDRRIHFDDVEVAIQAAAELGRETAGRSQPPGVTGGRVASNE
ncbi:MAG: UDP-N-acetylmuramoyl-L-alanyl-D-glutamate--2,6-diaminopimelate ligase, partial [Planctomycetota bacterium]